MRQYLRALLLLMVITAILFANGCAYTNVRSPYDVNIDNTDLGSKVGRASNYSAGWLVAWGDGSYEAAARQGGIKIMKHADYQFEQYLLGLFVKQTTIVYGD